MYDNFVHFVLQRRWSYGLRVDPRALLNLLAFVSIQPFLVIAPFTDKLFSKEKTSAGSFHAKWGFGEIFLCKSYTYNNYREVHHCARPTL
jgi:hypothetical protein